MTKSHMSRGVPTSRHDPKGSSQKTHDSVGGGSRPGGRSGPVTESSAPKDNYHIRGPVPGALK